MKIIVEDEYNKKTLNIEGEIPHYEDIVSICRTIIEFTGFNAEAVCEHIADTQREVL